MSFNIPYGMDVTELTNNVTINTQDFTVSGSGIFDDIMETVTKHLVAQFDAGRIRSEDYANAYVELLKVVLQAAIDAWLRRGLTAAQIQESEKKLELLDKQLDLLNKQLETEDAKKDLYRRQIEGFDEDFKYKILKIMMDSWAVGFSVAKDSFSGELMPSVVQKETIDDLYNNYIFTDFDNRETVQT